MGHIGIGLIVLIYFECMIGRINDPVFTNSNLLIYFFLPVTIRKYVGGRDDFNDQIRHPFNATIGNDVFFSEDINSKSD